MFALRIVHEYHCLLQVPVVFSVEMTTLGQSYKVTAVKISTDRQTETVLCSAGQFPQFVFLQQHSPAFPACPSLISWC